MGVLRAEKSPREAQSLLGGCWLALLSGEEGRIQDLAGRHALGYFWSKHLLNLHAAKNRKKYKFRV